MSYSQDLHQHYSGVRKRLMGGAGIKPVTGWVERLEQQSPIKTLKRGGGGKGGPSEKPSHQDIRSALQTVFELHGVIPAKVFKDERTRQYCAARNHFCFIMVREHGYTLSAVARVLGRDHTTVRSSVLKFQASLLERQTGESH